jgi:preprotein translocase subunit SecD
MDPELRQALEQIEQRISQSVHGEIRASEARMRGHVDASVRTSAEETRRHVDETAEQTRRHSEQGAEETRQRVDQVGQQTRRTGVIEEGHRTDIRNATEINTALNRRIDAVEGQGEQTRQRVDLLESRVSVLEGARRPRPRRRPT